MGGDEHPAPRGRAVMRATSDLQFHASATGTVPGLEQVREDVWALGMPMPVGHIAYSLLYLLRDVEGGIHVVDPGSDSTANLRALEAALADLGAAIGDVRSITATHLHPDHIGMAARLQTASGATVQVHAAEERALAVQSWRERTPDVLRQQLDAWGVPASRRVEFEELLRQGPARPPARIDRALRDGERLEVPGFDLVAMLTPGHTPGHLCLRDDARAVIFTGDHVLPTMHAGIGLGGTTETNPVEDYLSSLELLFAYPDHEVLPGHGYRFTGLRARAKKSALHHLRRSREVAAVLERAGDPSIWTIASQLTWAAGWENLSGFFAYSALSQTAIHKAFAESGGLDRFTADAVRV